MKTQKKVTQMVIELTCNNMVPENGTISFLVGNREAQLYFSAYNRSQSNGNDFALSLLQPEWKFHETAGEDQDENMDEMLWNELENIRFGTSILYSQKKSDLFDFEIKNLTLIFSDGCIGVFTKEQSRNFEEKIIVIQEG